MDSIDAIWRLSDIYREDERTCVLTKVEGNTSEMTRNCWPERGRGSEVERNSGQFCERGCVDRVVKILKPLGRQYDSWQWK